jgi:hypothetical protein
VSPAVTRPGGRDEQRRPAGLASTSPAAKLDPTGRRHREPPAPNVAALLPRLGWGQVEQRIRVRVLTDPLLLRRVLDSLTVLLDGTRGRVAPPGVGESTKA